MLQKNLLTNIRQSWILWLMIACFNLMHLKNILATKSYFPVVEKCKTDFKFTIYLIKNKRPTCYFWEYISCKRSLLPNYFEALPFEDWINEDSLNHMFSHLPDKNVNYLAKFVVFNKTLFSLSEGMESLPVLRKRL